MNFAFAGEMVPGMGSNSNSLRAINRYTGKEFGKENSFDGGDNGLQYRFWNQAENGYASSDIASDDAEILAEEAAFLGLENLFACRKQCKADLGGASSLRTCIRNCKGKGPKASVRKGMEAETSSKMADALTKMAGEGEAQASRDAAGSSKTVWIVVGVIAALIIIGLLIYFLTRKKAEVPVVA